MSYSHSHAQSPLHGLLDHKHSQNMVEYAVANKNHYDKEAATYDDPMKIEFAGNIVSALLLSYDFKPGETQVMEYACGTGNIARGLLPHAANVVGVDISQGMVDQFNACVKQLGLLQHRIYATVKDLVWTPGDYVEQFDVIVCSMAYHHFGDTAKTTATLARTLKPNGILFVVNHMAVPPNAETAHPTSKEIAATVPHQHGFDEANIRQLYEGAGLVDFKYNYAASFALGGQIMKTFLAWGRRPVTMPHL